MYTFFENVLKWFKKSSFGLIVTSFAVAFAICVGLIVSRNNDVVVNNQSDEINSVESNIPSTPTTEKERVKLPFAVDAKVARYFFDAEDTMEIKSQALVSYENKFIPSLGVDYTYDNKTFDVMAAFEGTVVEKKNDALYGLTIVIENEEGLRATYSGLSQVNAYDNSKIRQGMVIGKSGESVINASLGNHLHFAIEYKDDYLNPLKVYNKTISEIIN